MSKVMTRNPIFVTADSLAIEALQKMVQGNNTSYCLQLLALYFWSLCAIPVPVGIISDPVCNLEVLFVFFSRYFQSYVVFSFNEAKG